MTATAVEFAKMRHLRVVPVLGIMLLVAFASGMYSSVLSPDFVPDEARAWDSLLLGAGSGFAMGAPLTLAVLASRQVDMENLGGGWLLMASAAVAPGSVCRAKYAALAPLVASATVLVFAGLAGWGAILGVSAPFPMGRWLGATSAVMVVNLVVLAVQVLVSTRIENQLIGLGVGLLGTVFAMFAPSLPVVAAHLLPWGYYALAAAAEYQGVALVARTPMYVSVAASGIVAGVLFALLTRRADRQEV